MFINILKESGCDKEENRKTSDRGKNVAVVVIGVGKLKKRRLNEGIKTRTNEKCTAG